MIKTIPNPPFAQLPNPTSMFATRAARLLDLAKGHGLEAYLRFLAALAEAQQHAAQAAATPDQLTAADLASARSHAMPPLNRSAFKAGTSISALIDAIVKAMTSVDMPDEARAALMRVGAADPAVRGVMIANVLADAIPFEEVAEHAFVAAALQVEFALKAAQLKADDLTPVADGVCPTCGGPPVASVIVEWSRHEGTRYCSCALCGTLWNYIRAKCTLCAKTAKINFREIEGSKGGVKAEVCGDCKGYVKVLYHDKDPHLEPVADDVASIALDLLLRDEGFHRGGVNPFLTGY